MFWSLIFSFPTLIWKHSEDPNSVPRNLKVTVSRNCTTYFLMNKPIRATDWHAEKFSKMTSNFAEIFESKVLIFNCAGQEVQESWQKRGSKVSWHCPFKWVKIFFFLHLIPSSSSSLMIVGRRAEGRRDACSMMSFRTITSKHSARRVSIFSGI